MRPSSMSMVICRCQKKHMPTKMTWRGAQAVGARQQLLDQRAALAQRHAIALEGLAVCALRIAEAGVEPRHVYRADYERELLELLGV